MHHSFHKIVTCIVLFLAEILDIPSLDVSYRREENTVAQSYTHVMLDSVIIRNQLKFGLGTKYSRNWQSVSA